MRPALGIGMLALALLSCAGPALRYVPEPQPSGVPISADYRVRAGRLHVVADTGGLRVDAAQIVKPDGTTVDALAIEHPDPFAAPTFALGLGLGGAWSAGSAHLGTGVGVGTGRRPGPHTVVVFPLDAAGAAPWRLRLKLAAISPAVDIVLGAREP